jgi:zinc-finger of transposase IS204/IS1001/IS1096/IS1165
VFLLVGVILAGSAVVALGAARLGVPALVAFLAFGLLLGSDGPGGIDFDDAEPARNVSIVGLTAILLEGGLSTSWPRLRRVAARRAPTSLFDLPGVRVRHIERDVYGDRIVHVETADESASGCPDCGVVSTSVTQYVTTLPRDVPYGERGISLVWHKRRWRCVEPTCGKKSFTEVIDEVPARMRTTGRLRRSVIAEMVCLDTSAPYTSARCAAISRGSAPSPTARSPDPRSRTAAAEACAPASARTCRSGHEAPRSGPAHFGEHLLGTPPIAGVFRCGRPDRAWRSRGDRSVRPPARTRSPS